MSPSGDGPQGGPLPGLSGEEKKGLSEHQQKAAHQHLFHLREEEEGKAVTDTTEGSRVRFPGLLEL